MALAWPGRRGQGHARGVPRTLLRFRDDALTRARVWREPANAHRRGRPAEPRAGPLGSVGSDRLPLSAQAFDSGSTPKFHCVLVDGRVIKVKYGRLNAEPRTERAATRLSSTLGFGADRMHFVKRVRCSGCPAYPASALGRR